MDPFRASKAFMKDTFGTPRSMLSRDSPSNVSDAVLENVPSVLLESFIPGFGVISKIFEALTGIDITTIVTYACIIAIIGGAGSYVWKAASRFFFHWFTSSITINSNDRLFEQVMYWQSRHELVRGSRSLSAKTSKRNEDVADSRQAKTQAKYNYAEIESSVPPQFIPAYGNHVFWFNRRPLFLAIERQQQSGLLMMDYRGERDQPQTIKITCLGRTPDLVKDFLMDCKRFDALSNRSKTTIRRSVPQSNGFWQRSLERPSRPLETVYMDEEVKKEILQDINEFIDPAAPRFYARRGIPYRRGYLFWGPPGTGKTSLSFALAGHFGFDLYVVSLREPYMTEHKLTELFARLPAHCIVLLEDVDTAGLEKREEVGQAAKDNETAQTENALKSGKAATSTASDAITLSGVLNAIDGVASHEGRLLILTTNDPESLDKALIRPGRVDMQVYFGRATKQNAYQIFHKMYTVDEGPLAETHEPLEEKRSNEDAQAEIAPEEVERLALQFADIIPDLAFTPAEIQGFLLTRKKNPQKALEVAESWRDSLLAAHAAGKNIIAAASAEQTSAEQNDHGTEQEEK